MPTTNVPGPKVSARQRILHLLKRSRGLTAQEIARELGITAVAVRKHLDRMQEEGLILLSTRAALRGRPALVYALSESGEALFPQRYDQLLVDVLEDITLLEGEEKLVHLFHLRNE
ncbi:MAG TPA: HTH domain-containing protein, partial [Chloroflexota bacterium]|nr:HTH domain-containing protein [Chloroflexota bacterium]